MEFRTEQREEIQRQLALKLDFVPFAPLQFISARHGTGVGELMQLTVRAYEAAMREMPTRELTKTLEKAMTVHQPPMIRGRRIKLRYAHQGGRNPPRIVIHGNQTASVPDSYSRYLANVFRKKFDLFATPVAMEFRTDTNPYKKDTGEQTASRYAGRKADAARAGWPREWNESESRGRTGPVPGESQAGSEKDIESTTARGPEPLGQGRQRRSRDQAQCVEPQVACVRAGPQRSRCWLRRNRAGSTKV